MSKKKKKKFINFNENSNTNPDLFRDLDSVEDFIDSIMSKKEKKKSEKISSLPVPENISELLGVDSEPEVPVESNDVSIKVYTVNADDIEDIKDEQIEESSIFPSYNIYIDNFHRIHFSDGTLQDAIVDIGGEKIIDESFDSDTAGEILTKIRISLIETRIPSVITTVGEMKKDLGKITRLKNVVGVIYKRITDELKITDDTNISLFFNNDRFTNQYNEIVDLLIDHYDGDVNGAINDLLNLLNKATNLHFLLSDDYYYQKYTEYTSKIFTKTHEEIVNKYFDVSDDEVDYIDTLDNLFIDKFDELNTWFDFEDYESDSYESEGATNDEEPFCSNDDESISTIESGTGIVYDPSGESKAFEQKEQKEVESEETGEGSEEPDFSNAEEEVEEVEIEEVDEGKEGNMVIPVTMG